ncbi:VanZ family protein [Streptomyces sp. NPDC001750]|uniref:VanZ family protein n=1 Tax=Streptomyces sp. NPDC001750 TaxID=3364607 RepID=UPI0036891A65
MFVPIGFFGVLAVRRMLPVFLGGSLLSVVTELCQALAPWAGRSCDSSDVQMNVLGAGLGTLAAWASVRATRGELLPAQAVLKPMAVIFGNGLLACAVVWKLWITPLALDSTSLQMADGDEKAQARQVLSAAFDDHFDITNVQLQSGQNGASDMLMVTLKSGFAELSWPDKEQLTVSLENSSKPRSRQLPRDRVSVSPQERRRRTSDSKEVRGRTVPVGAGRLSREGFWVVGVHGDITVVVVGLRDCCTDLLVRVLDSPDLVVW